MDKPSVDEKKSARGLEETIGIYVVFILGFYLLGEFGYLDERTIEAFTWLFVLTLIVIFIVGSQIFLFRGRFKSRKSID